MQNDQSVQGRLDLQIDASDEEVLARLYGEPLFTMPEDLYIPPDALEVFMESFEGPLDLLLWLIRRQRFNIMDIPMATVTRQYIAYVEMIRKSNLELASDYLVMAATLLHIKSHMMLPKAVVPGEEEVGDPQAELARRLIEYEKIKLSAIAIDEMPRSGRDFYKAWVLAEQTPEAILPDVTAKALSEAFARVVAKAKLTVNHKVQRQELSVREFMSRILRTLGNRPFVEFAELFRPEDGVMVAVVNYLAILELAKEGAVTITQAVPYAPIYLTASLTLV